MRLLVPANESSSETLSPASGATGLWRAALRAEWDERREQDIERNRVQAGNCAMVDIGNEPAVLKLTAHGVFHVGRCQDGPQTNIVGAGWSSTHNPTNATDHLPHVEEVISQQYGPMCPVYTNTVVYAGWTHNTAILWIRNLVRILTGDPWDDDTDHCIALQAFTTIDRLQHLLRAPVSIRGRTRMITFFDDQLFPQEPIHENTTLADAFYCRHPYGCVRREHIFHRQ